MSDERANQAEVFKQEFPESRMVGLLMHFLNKNVFREFSSYYKADVGQGLDEKKVKLKAIEIIWLIERQIIKSEKKSDKHEISNFDSYIYRSIHNILFTDLKDERGMKSLTINNSLTTELREKSGIENLEINSKFIETINNIPGYQKAFLSSNKLIVSVDDIKSSFQNYIKRLENITGIHIAKKENYHETSN